MTDTRAPATGVSAPGQAAPAQSNPSQAPLADPQRLDPARAGAAALSGYVIWGLSPIFYKFLGFASASEIVLHRAVWSVPLLALLVWLAGRGGAALRLIADRKAMGLLLASSLLIAANWWIFIFAINSGRVLDVSLGYFVNPLMNVAVGVFIAHERFGKWRAAAVGLAALGVLNQVLAVGVFPWIGLLLAGTFTIYGYIRKTIATDGRIGLFWETVIIAIPSIFVLGFIEAGPDGRFFDGPFNAIMLTLTGPMTVAPLLLFIVGARGLHFATIGVLQFIAPTLQFAVGIAYGEAFTPAHAVTFALIWLGLAVFVADLLRQERLRKKTAPRQTA